MKSRTIELKRKGLFIAITSVLSMIAGIFLCITIIGIIPGLAFLLLPIMFLSYKVTCPGCNEVNVLFGEYKLMVCKNCKAKYKLLYK